MSLKDRITALGRMRTLIKQRDERLQACVEKSHMDNPWFTVKNVWTALDNISNEFLDPDKLNHWVAAYDLREGRKKTVGLIMAGNIPLVGFHDWLSVFISGLKSSIKLSSRDPYLLPFLVRASGLNDNDALPQTEFVDKLKGMDAIIATGSDNSSRYFEYYFGEYPNIIRKNRTSIAVIRGDETDEELKALGMDVFQFFGMGCRSVSTLWIPEDFDLDRVFSNWTEFGGLIEHSKYRHNYEYNYSVYALNNIPFLTNNVVMLKEDDGLHPPLSVIFYRRFKDIAEVDAELSERDQEIQCVVSSANVGERVNVPFGKAQSPGLSDYADHVDTMQFLSSL